MFHRHYGIFKSYRDKRRCTYTEMYKWYTEHCDINDSLAIDKFYSAYWKAMDYSATLNGIVTVGLREDCSSIAVLKHNELGFKPVEFVIGEVDTDSLRRNHVTDGKNYESLDGEIWKVVKEYPEYKVSSLGRIKNSKTNAIKRLDYSVGYPRFYVHSGKKHLFVHRVVAKTFIPNQNNYPEVNHINGNKQDNRVENLEWCTREYNFEHAMNVLGHEIRKLTYEEAQKIREDVLNGKYKSLRAIAREYDVSRDCIYDILDNITYKTANSKPINIFRKSFDKNTIDEIAKDNIIECVRNAFLNETLEVVKELSKRFNLEEDTIINIISNTLPKMQVENTNDLMRNNTSGYTNITKQRKNRWRVIVSDNDKRVGVGFGFKTQKEALEALNKYIVDHNLPNEIQEYCGERNIINKYQEKAQKEYEEQNLSKELTLRCKEN